MDPLMTKMLADFDAGQRPELEAAKVWAYEYEQEPYHGSAWGLWEVDGKLYEVHGSHCSCHGLEDQFEPEETTWEALALRDDPRVARALAARSEVV